MVLTRIRRCPSLDILCFSNTIIVLIYNFRYWDSWIFGSQINTKRKTFNPHAQSNSYNLMLIVFDLWHILYHLFHWSWNQTQDLSMCNLCQISAVLGPGDLFFWIVKCDYVHISIHLHKELNLGTFASVLFHHSCQ